MNTSQATESVATEAPRRLPRTSTTTTILLFGHLSWLAWVWVITATAFTVVMVVVGRYGSLEESLWQSAGGGWQRWVVLGAGITTVAVYLRLFVSNGVTRAQLSRSSFLAMGVVAVLGATLICLGYLLEQWFFDRNDWPQVLRSDSVFETTDLGRAFVESVLALCAYFVSGWLIGATFYGYGTGAGLLALVPSLVPAALVQLLVSRDYGGVNVDVIPGFDEGPNLLLTIGLGLMVVGSGAWLAQRVTSRIPLRSC